MILYSADIMISNSEFEAALKKEEIHKWRDLKQGIYEILEENEFEGKYGLSMILKLKSKDKIFKCWAPKRLSAQLMDEDYTHVRHNGLKESKNGNKYFSFDLVSIPEESESESDSD